MSKVLPLACVLALSGCNMCALPGGNSKRVAAKAQINAYMTALQTYRRDTGGFPTNAQGLEALRRNPGVAGWDGPYVDKDIAPDPWGHPYIYRYHSVGVPEIISQGQSARLEPSLDSCKLS